MPEGGALYYVILQILYLPFLLIEHWPITLLALVVAVVVLYFVISRVRRSIAREKNSSRIDHK
jgi:uncharacterized membrane protein